MLHWYPVGLNESNHWNEQWMVLNPTCLKKLLQKMVLRGIAKLVFFMIVTDDQWGVVAFTW